MTMSTGSRRLETFQFHFHFRHTPTMLYDRRALPILFLVGNVECLLLVVFSRDVLLSIALL